jgi:hypothetical protein
MLLNICENIPNYVFSMEEEHTMQMFWKRTMMESIMVWTKDRVVEVYFIYKLLMA